MQKPEDASLRSCASHANGVVANGLHYIYCGGTLGVLALNPSGFRNIRVKRRG